MAITLMLRCDASESKRPDGVHVYYTPHVSPPESHHRVPSRIVIGPYLAENAGYAGVPRMTFQMDAYGYCPWYNAPVICSFLPLLAYQSFSPSKWAKVNGAKTCQSYKPPSASAIGVMRKEDVHSHQPHNACCSPRPNAVAGHAKTPTDPASRRQIISGLGLTAQ